MKHVESVLCLTDFSDCSKWAVDRAASLAGKYDATLHLVNVRVVDRGDMKKAESHPELTHFIDLLAKLAHEDLDAIEVDDALRVERRVLRGEDSLGPAIEYARDAAADLIVVGTHGRGGLARALLGSLAEKLLRRSPVSVLIVGQATPADCVFERIVVPIDFSETSSRSLTPVLAFARKHGASLSLLHVVDPLSHPGGFLLDKVSSAKTFSDLRGQAERGLHDLVAGIDSTGTEIETVVLEGVAPRRIAEFAERSGADLIAMATRTEGVQRLLAGGITARVVRRATCPVLVAR